jgi:hypothetical protein
LRHAHARWIVRAENDAKSVRGQNFGACTWRDQRKEQACGNPEAGSFYERLPLWG